MNFETALLAAVGGLVATVVALAGGIVFLYKRDVKRQQSSEARIDGIRKSMEARMESSEANCRTELSDARGDLTQARADISRLSEDVSKLSQGDRDMAVGALLLYADKRDADRELLERIAGALAVEIPPVNPSRRTTVYLKALTGGKR